MNNDYVDDFRNNSQPNLRDIPTSEYTKNLISNNQKLMNRNSTISHNSDANASGRNSKLK